MSHDLADPGPVPTPDSALSNRAITVWSLALGVCLALGTTVAIHWALSVVGIPRRVLDPVLWIGAPIAALTACALAARAAAGNLRGAWIFFGIAALAALPARAPWVAEPLEFDLFSEAGAVVFALAGYLLLSIALAVGGLFMERQTTRYPRSADTQLDAALTIAAVVLLLERFYFPLLQGAEATALLSGLLVLLFAVAPFFSLTVMALRPDYRLPEFVPPFLFIAATCLILGSGLAAIPTNLIAAASESASIAPDALITLAGWTVLALTGFAAARARPGAATMAADGGFQRRIQQFLAPGVALLLGSITIDAALRSQATVELGIVSTLLGVLLAVRIRRTLRAGEEHAEAQRLLEQNSALVEVSRALADATDLNRTLDLVARWACQLLDASGAAVELLDPDQDELEIRALHGIIPYHLLGLRTPVEGTLTGSVVRSGQAITVSAPGYDSFDFSDRADALGAFPTAAAPLHYRNQRLGALFAIRFDRTFDSAELELLGALADQASLAIRNAQLFEQVRALSLTDPLTGLANRRQLARDLAREFAATRRGRQLIAVVFDLDNFKVYNDQYGHPAGDEVLRIFGEVLAAETRAMNLAARYGGDEFVALLADTPIDGASVFIERVTTHFQEEMDRLGRGIITISAGYAECDPNMKTPDELIAAADRALYRVKPGRVAQDSA